MYGAEAAEVYDLVHRARGKDFEQEARIALTHARRRGVGAGSLLDVACGTGEHLSVFDQQIGHVAGVDLSADMLAVCRRRLPGVDLTRADMRDFALGSRFDIITCLFCAIAYLGTTDDLRRALRCFARHLVPGGVAVVEPWWFPERFTPGHVAADVVRDGSRTVARLSHASLVPAGARMEVHYVVAEESTGVRHFSEEHVYSLFTRAEYESAFAESGFDVEYVADGARGLFVGVLRG